MTLAYISSKSPSKLNTMIENFHFVKFRKIIMNILGYLTSFAIGINVSAICVEKLLSKYAFNTYSWHTVKSNIDSVMNITDSSMFYGLQIFSIIMVLVFMITSIPKFNAKEFTIEMGKIIFGTVAFYLAFVLASGWLHYFLFVFKTVVW